ncbi:hypothetical protein [Microcoleus sp. OTE_8_concoct_300]|uniref:hypothetical protein n=1 Tax=Microcoleus sp. OTE_8_concoct_300 TaxID=2964710 RepID=UPI00403F4BEC
MSGRRKKQEGSSATDYVTDVTDVTDVAVRKKEEGRRKKEESSSTSRSGNKKSEGRGNRPNWFGPLRTSSASGAVAISAPAFRSWVMGQPQPGVASWKLYHVRSRNRDFCRGGFANNTCQQSPISKTRPDRDIMVN